MNPALILAFVALAILALVAWFGGRALSRRRAFPCPAKAASAPGHITETASGIPSPWRSQRMPDECLAALRQYFSWE